MLEGLAAGDRASLAALRLSRDEYVDVVWPELPASDPDLNVPIEYVWADIEARDRRALIRLAPQFEGLAAELEDVACTGEVEELETFRVHTDCWVILRTPSGKHRIQLFKDVVERGAGYKLFRYYDDVLRPVETGPAGRARTRVGEAARLRQLPLEEVNRCPTTTTSAHPSIRREVGHLPGAPGHPDPAAGRVP